MERFLMRPGLPDESSPNTGIPKLADHLSDYDATRIRARFIEITGRPLRPDESLPKTVCDEILKQIKLRHETPPAQATYAPPDLTSTTRGLYMALTGECPTPEQMRKLETAVNSCYELGKVTQYKHGAYAAIAAAVSIALTPIRDASQISLDAKEVKIALDLLVKRNDAANHKYIGEVMSVIPPRSSPPTQL